MNQNKDELLPCPFDCPGTPPLILRSTWNTPYFVQCQTCGARGPEVIAETQEESWKPLRKLAVKWWNTRTSNHAEEL